MDEHGAFRVPKRELPYDRTSTRVYPGIERTGGKQCTASRVSDGDNRPSVSEVRMVGGGVNGGGTGAWVAEHEEKGLDGVNCPATTLDHLFAGKIPRDARCLCKLDLERHELAALEGAARILRSVEIVLTEVHFFDVNGAGRPIFPDMVSFLQTHGFELYDFASLGARPRDMRLQIGDVVFVRNDSPLLTDNSWQ